MPDLGPIPHRTREGKVFNPLGDVIAAKWGKREKNLMYKIEKW
jgi:hypothetical protein